MPELSDMPEDDGPTNHEAGEQLRREQRDERWRKLAARSRLKKRLLLFVGIAVALWAVWTQVLYPTYTARYELTIEVETPDGIKTGSSVIEARYGWEPTLFGLISGVKNSYIGSAVYVELEDGKNLVVTLTDRMSNRNTLRIPREHRALNAIKLPSAVFGFPTHDRIFTPAGIAEASVAGEREFDVRQLPLVVSFADISDPKSVRRVDPMNLDTVGEGMAIKSAKISITDKPFEFEILKRLPWLESLKRDITRLSGSDSVAVGPGLAEGLGAGDFFVRPE